MKSRFILYGSYCASVFYDRYSDIEVMILVDTDRELVFSLAGKKK